MLYELTGATKKIGNITLYEFIQPCSAHNLGGWIDNPIILKNLKNSEIGLNSVIYGSKICKDIHIGPNCIIAYSTIMKKTRIAANSIVKYSTILGDNIGTAVFQDPIYFDNIELWATGVYDYKINDKFISYRKMNVALLLADNWVRLDCVETDWETGLKILFNDKILADIIAERDPRHAHSDDILQNLDWVRDVARKEAAKRNFTI